MLLTDRPLSHILSGIQRKLDKLWEEGHKALYMGVFGTAKTMDEREIEQGYASFHRKLNDVLRQKDVRHFKAHVARHPRQAGRLSHCLGLSDELAEVEMYKAIVVRSALKDLHSEALNWLKKRGFDPPPPRPKKGGHKKPYGKKRKVKNA